MRDTHSGGDDHDDTTEAVLGVPIKKRRVSAEATPGAAADAVEGAAGMEAAMPAAGAAPTATTTTTTATATATTAATTSSSSPRALEFYCGVGGLHYSLLRARPSAAVVAAFDINPNSNDVYEHNFGVRPLQKNLFGKRVRAAHPDVHLISLFHRCPLVFIGIHRFVGILAVEFEPQLLCSSKVYT